VSVGEQTPFCGGVGRVGGDYRGDKQTQKKKPPHTGFFFLGGGVCKTGLKMRLASFFRLFLVVGEEVLGSHQKTYRKKDDKKKKKI